MLTTVGVNLAEGAALVVAVLFLTLGQLARQPARRAGDPAVDGRSRVIGMVQLGVTGNLMSLGAIDFGLLVDGAIVMLEVDAARAASSSGPTPRGRRRRLVAQSMKRVGAAGRVLGRASSCWSTCR